MKINCFIPTQQFILHHISHNEEPLLKKFSYFETIIMFWRMWSSDHPTKIQVSNFLWQISGDNDSTNKWIWKTILLHNKVEVKTIWTSESSLYRPRHFERSSITTKPKFLADIKLLNISSQMTSDYAGKSIKFGCSFSKVK